MFLSEGIVCFQRTGTLKPEKKQRLLRVKSIPVFENYNSIGFFQTKEAFSAQQSNLSGYEDIPPAGRRVHEQQSGSNVRIRDLP